MEEKIFWTIRYYKDNGYDCELKWFDSKLEAFKFAAENSLKSPTPRRYKNPERIKEIEKMIEENKKQV